MTGNTNAGCESVSNFLKALDNAMFDSQANKILARRLYAVENMLWVLASPQYQETRVVMDATRELRNFVDSLEQNNRMMMKRKGVPIVRSAIRLHCLQ